MKIIAPLSERSHLTLSPGLVYSAFLDSPEMSYRYRSSIAPNLGNRVKMCVK